MATVTPILDIRSVKKDGTSPVKFNLRHNGGAVMLSTGVSLKPEQWDGHNVIAKNHKQGRVLHAALAARYAEIQQVVLDLTMNRRIKVMTAVQLKKIIEKKLSDPSVSEITFTDYMRQFIEKKEKDSTKEICRVALRKVIAYGGENLLFSDITIDFRNIRAGSGTGTANRTSANTSTCLC